MAVKKNLADPYTIEDIYDTQNALDKGILGSVNVPTTTTTTHTEKGGWQNMNRSDTTTQQNPIDPYGKDNFGSILGMTDAINANRKKRAEQDKTAGQGFGLSSSILGGGAF